MRVKYLTDVSKLDRLSDAERRALTDVQKRFAFRVTDYYLGLINWDDPKDPIRQLIIPNAQELSDWGRLDASNEAAVTKSKGVQHKYPHTVLLLCNEICGAYCRYCFRKRLFMNGNDEVSMDVSAGVRYIAERPQVTNVLLTGGDPLLLSTRRLRQIISELRAIPHVQIVRIGSKMPAFNPWRILDDPDLLAMFREYSSPSKRLYLMAHFDHPRELTEPVVEAMDAVYKAGVVAVNQCPLLGGINDDPETLAELFRKLSFIGCPPYYLFQGRPTAGNEPFAVPLVRGYEVFETAKKMVSGLAKRARFVMSHETGKIEIVGLDSHSIYLRYHRAKDLENEGRFMIFRRDDEAFWLDDLEPTETTARDGHTLLSASAELASAAANMEDISTYHTE